MHESWHRVQEALGLPSTGPANAHLDALLTKTLGLELVGVDSIFEIDSYRGPYSLGDSPS